MASRLSGRRAVIVSEPTITEVVSAVARRRREGLLNRRALRRVHASLRELHERGQFLRTALSAQAHREAERLLISLEEVPLRAADALHLSMAGIANARTLATFDKRLSEAARAVGLAVIP